MHCLETPPLRSSHLTRAVGDRLLSRDDSIEVRRGDVARSGGAAKSSSDAGQLVSRPGNAPGR